MTNFEKYSALHNEIMKRLEAGEITTEAAKSVIDMSFDKYITEASVKDVVKSAAQKVKDKAQAIRNKLDLMMTRDTFAHTLKNNTNKPDDQNLKAEFKASIKKCSDELAHLADTYCNKIDVVSATESEDSQNKVKELEDEYKDKLKQTIKKYPLIANNMKEEL